MKKKTQEAKKFWALAEQTSERVGKWPEWKQRFALGHQPSSERSKVSAPKPRPKGGVTRDGADTVTDTGVAVSAGSWVKLRITVNAAGTSVAFAIDGTTVATHTTNIAGGTNVLECTMTRIAGTAARVVDVDLLRFAKTLTTGR